MFGKFKVVEMCDNLRGANKSFLDYLICLYLLSMLKMIKRDANIELKTTKFILINDE